LHCKYSPQKKEQKREKSDSKLFPLKCIDVFLQNY
jgi:hypothetical protein